VKRLIPKDQLLIHQPSDGYAPLCEFLGVECPDEPYPHVNDKADFRRKLLFLSAMFYGWPIVVVSIAFWLTYTLINWIV
jgi:hypothetical protein